MADRIQLRNDDSAVWALINPTLLDGEIGFERDTRRFKIGDGATAWNGLPYQQSGQIGNVSAVNVGTADAIVVAFSPAITQHIDTGLMFIEHGAQNEGPVTIAVDGMAPVETYKHNNAPLQQGDIQGDGWIGMWRYNVTLNKYQLLNPRVRETYSANFNVIGEIAGGWNEDRYRWHPPRRVYIQDVRFNMRIPSMNVTALQVKKNGAAIGDLVIIEPNQTQSEIVSLLGNELLPSDHLTISLVNGGNGHDMFVQVRYN